MMKKTMLVCLLMLATQACGGGAAGSSGPVQAPENPNEKWTLATPAEVGMDPVLLGKAVSDLPTPKEHGLASMLVLRHGKPIMEQYWNGYDRNSMHDLRSATKSITSLLTGIAIDQGKLSGVDEPIKTRLAAAYPNAPGLARDITLKHLLTMRSGLACDDRDPGSPGNEENMYPKTDWVSFFVNLPAAAPPDTQTHYCTAGVVTLGRVLAEASGRAIPDFAATNLFAPIGIVTTRWADFDNHKQTDTGGHLYLRPRDMAKLGQLVLQHGMWDGRQVVSAAWIAQATSYQTLMDEAFGYGYLWWLRKQTYAGQPVTLHYTHGNGGQYIIVIPELDLVAVFAGENYNSDKAARPFQIMQDYVLPSIR